jgi:hypothetical protein
LKAGNKDGGQEETSPVGAGCGLPLNVNLMLTI